MKQQHTLQPKLRFPEFEGDWEKEFIKNISDFIGGGTPDTSKSEFWQGNIPWISSSDIFENDISKISLSRFINLDALNNSATKLIPKGSLLIVSRVGVGKFAIAPKDICTSQDFTNLILKEDEVNNSFLAYQLFANKNILLKISQGTSIKGFTSSDLKSVLVHLTSLPEQKKIADYLSTIDTKINLLEEKKAQLALYKKAMMQKLFSQEIRFKDDNGNDFPEWEEKRLGEVFLEIKEKVGTKKIATYSISAGKGFISQEEKFGRDISGKQNSNYIIIQRGDLAYNKGNSKTYKYGCVYKSDFENLISVPNVFICFRGEQSIVEPQFFAKLFENKYLDPFLRKIISSGARMDGLLNVSKEDFFKINIPLPSLPEQQKIADFLSAIDASIEKVNEQITQTQSFKKAMLQQMFV